MKGEDDAIRDIRCSETTHGDDRCKAKSGLSLDSLGEAGRMGEATRARSSSSPFERCLVCFQLFKPPLFSI
jgi:hypothetical protein